MPLRISNVCCVASVFGVSFVLCRSKWRRSVILYLLFLPIPSSNVGNYHKTFVDKGFSGPEVITVDFFALIQERRVSTGIVHSSVRLGCVVWPCRVATSIFI